MNKLQILAASAGFALFAGAAQAQGTLPPAQGTASWCWSGSVWSPCLLTPSVTTTPLALTPVTASTAVESNHVLKGSAGTFYGVQVNTTSAAEWVMLFNATTLPANGAVTPVAVWQVPANTTLSISENPAFTMSTGIVIGCSTTGPFTLTASALCTFAGGSVQ